MNAARFLILGAGPTGLGAAWRLAGRGQTDWLVCEADAIPGGLARSVVDEHGFTWDLGGHVQFSHYDHFENLMDELLGPEGWLYHERSSWVWVAGRFVPYPFQLNLKYLPRAEQWRAVQGLLELRKLQDWPAPADPANFGEWIDAVFGRGIAELFLRPYNFKVWAFPPEEMTWRWIGDRVATVDLERAIQNILLDRDDVSWGPNNRFRFPRQGGTGVVWKTLAERLEAAHPGRIALNRRLTALDTTSRLACFDDGSTVRYEKLLSTIPLDDLVGLSDLSDEVGGAVADLRHSSTHVLGVGLLGAPPKRLEGKCWMYFPEEDCPFYRVTVFSHYSPRNVPDIARTWSLMAEVSESPVKPVDMSHVARETVAGMIATGLVHDSRQVHHVWHARLPHGYPTPSLHRDRALGKIRPAFEAREVYSRGRFGAWKYEVSNQDHSFAQGVEVVDHWLDGSPEETLNDPDAVNARRPKPRTEGAK